MEKKIARWLDSSSILEAVELKGNVSIKKWWRGSTYFQSKIVWPVAGRGFCSSVQQHLDHLFNSYFENCNSVKKDSKLAEGFGFRLLDILQAWS